VGGGAGDDLDGSDVLEAAERADQVAAVAITEVAESFAEHGLPVPGDAGPVMVAFPRKDLGVVAGRLDFRLEPGVEFVEKRLAGELLGEDRRDADGDAESEPLVENRLDAADQGEVAFRGGLAEPLGPVGPPSMGEDVGEVRVEDECERAEFHGALEVVEVDWSVNCTLGRPAFKVRSRVGRQDAW